MTIVPIHSNNLKCEFCGEPLPPGNQRLRKYCNQAHRQAHYRRREQPVIPLEAQKVCILCHVEKDLIQFDGVGMCVKRVCLSCARTLPPIPPGQRRCPACLALHKYNDAYCKPCKSAYVKARYSYDRTRDANLRRNYGITLEEYNLMFFRQGGLCAICHQPESITDPYTKRPKWLVLDHSHETGEPRELLCHRCNIVLGELEKDRHIIKNMLRYLKKHDR